MAKLTAKTQDTTRRQPTQARAQQRVDDILRTAEALFAQEGIDGVSTNQIAEKAGVSIGSLYQFFGNKDAIVTALVDRYRVHMVNLLAGISGDIPSMSVADLVGRMVDAGAEFVLRHAAFGKLLLAAHHSPALVNAQRALRSGMLQVIESVIALRAPWVSADDRRISATLAQTLQRGVMDRVIEAQQAGNTELIPRLLAESKRMQIAYFEQLLAGGDQASTFK